MGSWGCARAAPSLAIAFDCVCGLVWCGARGPPFARRCGEGRWGGGLRCGSCAWLRRYVVLAILVVVVLLVSVGLFVTMVVVETRKQCRVSLVSSSRPAPVGGGGLLAERFAAVGGAGGAGWVANPMSRARPGKGVTVAVPPPVGDWNVGVGAKAAPGDPCVSTGALLMGGGGGGSREARVSALRASEAAPSVVAELRTENALLRLEMDVAAGGLAQLRTERAAVGSVAAAGGPCVAAGSV